MTPTDTTRRSIKLVLHGRVQGVGMRYQVRWKAEELGLAGWVSNQPDGTVAIHIEGPSHKVAEFREWIRSGAAPASRISRTEVFPTRTEELDDFQVR